MVALIGDKWQEWGSEQVSSNYLIANSPNSFVLPYPKYAFYWKDADLIDSAFLHFAGTYRFDNGLYKKLSRQVIEQLKSTTS